jgi:hypothetical protein
MFRRSDLKRLKKSELLALAKDDDRPCTKRSKQQLIDSLCDESTSTARTGVAGCDGKIRLLYASVGFRPLKDDGLSLLPRITFAGIYAYFHGINASFKSIDRAVKHVSAGDISSVSFTKVSCFPVTTYSQPSQYGRVTSR